MKSTLSTDADRPTDASVACRCDKAVEKVQGEFVSLPRAAKLNVAKETVPAITDTASQRGHRLGPKASHRVEKDAISFETGIDPIVVALDSTHPTAGELGQ